MSEQQKTTHVVLPINVFNATTNILQQLPWRDVSAIMNAVQSTAVGVAKTEDGYDEVNNDPARGAAED